MTQTQPKTPYQVLIEMLDPENMEEKEREAIWTLLQYLKKREVAGRPKAKAPTPEEEGADVEA
jgi:hypothetical protein